MDMLSLLAVNTDNLMKALEIMWKGVVAIFLVIALIIIVTKIVNTVCVRADMKRAEKQKENTQENEAKQ